MKKRIFAGILFICLLIALCPETARADMGPKPSVQITFRGLENRQYAVTLLSSVPSTGPWYIDQEFHGWMGSRQVWDAFFSYKDSSGYYYLGFFQDCSESQCFTWDYYPPEQFKVLLYFPELNCFLVSSQSFSRYAFDSYFTLDLSGVTLPDAPGDSEAPERIVFENELMRQTYDYTWEAVSLLFRIVGTLLTELAVAWPFGYLKKHPFSVILATNLVTQTLLNAALNLINFRSGYMAFLAFYFLLELLVFLIEGGLYQKFLYIRKDGETKKGHPWIYAAVANALSLLTGLLIARWVPGIF